MSDRLTAALDARGIASVLRKEAARCLQLASTEEKAKTREGYLGLAHSYEVTARSILKRVADPRAPERLADIKVRSVAAGR